MEVPLLAKPSVWPGAPTNEALNARIEALQQEVAKLPRLPPTPQTGPATAEPADDDAGRALDDALREFEEVRDQLAERRVRSWSTVYRAVAVPLSRIRDIADARQGRDSMEARFTLAHLEFQTGQLRLALQDYARIAQEYQDSEVAWAAEMRAAQLTQSVDDADGAAARFARVAERYADKPMVPPLARFYEARAYEASQKWPEAMAARRSARGRRATTAGSASSGNSGTLRTPT